MFNLKKLQNKGQGALSSGMKGLLTAVILIFMVVALAPSVFTELGNVNTTGGAPSWVVTLLPILVGAVFIFIIWRAGGGNA